MPLKPALKSPYPTDEEVVRRINEAIAKKPFWLPDGSQPQMLFNLQRIDRDCTSAGESTCCESPAEKSTIPPTASTAS